MAFLVFIPCSDDYLVAQGNRSELVIEKHSHVNEFELCSPFCVCDCCQIPVNTVTAPLIGFILLNEYSLYVFFPQAKELVLTPNIWKPPKQV